MLTPDLVRTRRTGNKLKLLPLQPHERERALLMANSLLACTRAHVGQTRETWEEAMQAYAQGSIAEKQLALALTKLIEDDVVFDAIENDRAETIRRDLFTKTAVFRKQQTENQAFPRQQLLQETANAYEMSIEQLENCLYADLRSAHRISYAPAHSHEHLIDLYEQGQAQAILLRAASVQVDITCDSVAAYRNFFRKIKFLRLLARIEPLHKSQYRLQVEGPFRLFEATTKYGLQLALLFPILQQCQEFKLIADIRWGKQRMPLVFEWTGGSKQYTRQDEQNSVSEEVATLLQKWEQHSPEWSVEVCPELLLLPGCGICIPDLQFVHRKTGEVIYLEVLGFWSREAVWKRIEAVQKGIPYKILFAVNKHLRVSEQALEGTLPGMLYVYSNTLQPKAIAERLYALCQRTLQI